MSLAEAKTPPPPLHDLAHLLPLGEYLRQIVARRDFLWSLPSAELRSRNADTALGPFWLVLNPLFLILVYYLLFSVLLDISRGVTNYAAFLGVGIFCFHLSQRTVLASARVMFRNQSLIRALYFPRAILPLALVLENLIAFLPAIGVLLAFIWITGEPPRWSWLLLAPLVLAQSLFNLGLSLWAARVGDRSLDFANLLPYLFRLLLYGSGVLYSVEAFVSDPRWLRLFDLNPFYCLVSISRAVLLGLTVRPEAYVSLTVWTVGLLVTGFFVFRRGETTYGIG